MEQRIKDLENLVYIISFTLVIVVIALLIQVRETKRELKQTIEQVNRQTKVILKHEQRLNNQKEYILKLKRDK